MTRTTRRLLFFVFAALFVIIGIAAMLVSQGIRIDTSSFAFEKTGGIFIAALPADAAIFINDLPTRSDGGVFQENVFVGDLAPGAYRVRIEKEGFYPYGKEFPVEPGLVTRATHVVLAPQKITAVSGPPRDEPSAPPVLYDAARAAYMLRDAATGSLLNINLLFSNLKERQLGLPGAVTVTNAFPHPFNADQVFIMTRRAMYLLNARRVSLELLAQGTPRTAAVLGNRLVWAEYDEKSDATVIRAYDTFLRTVSSFDETISGEPDAFVPSSVSDTIVIRRRDGAAFVWDDPGNAFHRVGRGPLERIRVSPDGNRIAFAEVGSSAVAVYDTRTATTASFPLDSAPMRDGIWYADSFHLFVRANDSAFFLDTDEKTPVYAPRIADGVSAFSYDADRNRLYVSDDAGAARFLDFNF
ncbi:MAG: hypothetical protein HYS43_00175 [Candidatus Liptonbacteria bacterium]|nr:hypothetical protein [Candidatus Liptonbacteria bacterium]